MIRHRHREAMKKCHFKNDHLKAVVLFFMLFSAVAGHSQSFQTNHYRRQYDAFAAQQKFEIADLYADTVLRVANKTNNFDSIANTYQWLYEINHSRKNFEKALHFFQVRTHFVDSVNTLKQEATEEDLRVLLVRQEEDHQKKETAWRENIQELQLSGEREIRNAIIILGGMFALSGIVIIVFYRRGRQINQVLEKSRADIQQLESFKEKLYTVLSYDLKNAFTAFENLTNGLEGQLKTLDQGESVQLISNLHDTASDLKGTLHNVILWVGYEAHAKPYQPDFFDSKAFVEKVIGRFRLQLTSKRLTASAFIPDNQLVFADREMVEIIVENLISNAIHFTPSGGTITCFSGRKEGLVTMGVKDTGIGISPEDISKLFDVKEDFHAIGKPSHKGSGVGLILCKELVERNGGRIYVESTVGQGSTFYFTLREK